MITAIVGRLIITTLLLIGEKLSKKKKNSDLKNLELNFKNVSIVVVVTFILSNILTPLAGIPVGLLGSAYWIQNRKRKQS
ncbi:VraH family peptide resistance protein [Staphylococcus hominis]|uniref:VraH family peptide resistance protein n=2 Tax=Staphylococcus hominis TaxID=1290 RepID=UPI001E59C51F|nr:VraH family protein [Staphylococcus hominis]